MVPPPRRRRTLRPISQGREVYLDHFPLIREMFLALEWYSFFLTGGKIYPRLVHEFYSNYAYNDGMVTFTLFERSHSHTLYEFGGLLGIPCVQDGYPTLSNEDMWRALCREGTNFSVLQRDGIKEFYLREECVVPNEIIRSNVFHREETEPTLTVNEQRLLWCLLNGVPINVAGIVASRMSELLYEHQRPLPYGALLTNLFSRICDISNNRRVLDNIGCYDISTRPINGELSEDENMSVAPQSSSDSGTSSTRSDARSNRRRR